MGQIRWSLLIGIYLLLLTVVSAEDMRVWTAVNGQTLEAKFIQMSGPKVVLEKTDGKRIMIAKKSLCEADQVYLADAIPPELKIDVDRDKESQKLSQGYSWTEKQETITLDVTISKVNRDKCTRKLKAKLYMLAENKGDSSSHKVIEYKEYPFDFLKSSSANFDASATVRNEQGYSYAEGWEYYGYVIVVEDESGGIIATDASKSTFVSKLDAIEKGRDKNFFKL